MIQTTAAAPENFSEKVVALYNENGRRKENVTAMINYYRGLVRGGGMRQTKTPGSAYYFGADLNVVGRG